MCGLALESSSHSLLKISETPHVPTSIVSAAILSFAFLRADAYFVSFENSIFFGHPAEALDDPSVTSAL